MLAEPHVGMPLWQLCAEVALWSLPAVLAWRLWWRSPRGAANGWLVVALVTTVISVDKAIDLQMMALPWLQRLAHWIDPQASRAGGHRLVRVALVLAFAAVLAAGLWLVLRRDRQLTGPKWLSFAGLVGVVLYLAVRQLLPDDRLGDAGKWAAELACWAMVLGGELWGGRRSSADAVLLDP